VTHASASYHHDIRTPQIIITALLAGVALAACGSQKSTLPPAPGTQGTVALRYLAHDPEVYANAQVATLGTVGRTRAGRTTLYVLDGGRGARIVLEPADPAASVAGYLGERVEVSGLFAVSFQLGYEILVSRIAAAGTL
jgi:hypothetical protein